MRPSSLWNHVSHYNGSIYYHTYIPAIIDACIYPRPQAPPPLCTRGRAWGRGYDACRELKNLISTDIDSERPVISELPASYSTPVGGQLEITCTTVTPSSLATVLWMKKGGRVPITGTRVWQNGNGNLVFESVLVSDQGPYWCVVWNEGGVTMEMTELVIIDDVIENTPPLESDSITIQCSLFLITSLITGASLYMS